MLNIYTDKNLITLPMIKDPEIVFRGIKLENTDFTQKVITKIEKGKYIDDEVFEDRFGRNLYLTCMSTTSKILILLSRYKDYAILCDELGKNGLNLLLELEDGNAYFENRDVEFPNKLIKPVMCNGVAVDTTYNLNMMLSGSDLNYGD
jgi:hypothetical protein